MKKIGCWKDFEKFVGADMYELVKAMPDCFDRVVMESGRQVWANIHTDERIEILHNGFSVVEKVVRWF